MLCLAIAVGFACSKGPAKAATSTPGTDPAKAGATGQPGQPGQAPAAKPVPAQLPEVLAKVNGAPVNKEDFERALHNLEAQAGGPVPPDRRDAIYRQVLDQMVALKLLSQESQARKVAVADTEVDGKVNEIKGQFPNEQAFTQALQQRQMTPDKLKADIRQQLQAMKLVQSEVESKVQVGDPEIQAFYQKNPDKFQQPEAVHVYHILIRLPENADAAAKQKAKAEAESVLAQAKKGTDFAALAKKHSQDTQSAVNGGDLGFLAKGQAVPPFEAAAFALKPGQLSGVVETQFGYHVMKGGEHRDARTIPLDEVKAQVGQFLKQQLLEEKTNAFIEQLKSKAKVEILI